jgi:hypothetical protein
VVEDFQEIILILEPMKTIEVQKEENKQKEKRR